ncbi:MAG: FAD-binding oxidoreductase, partial [Rhodobacterales bacterium]|nr:FAD-binding oxidoreductase [Rhodobacterales bacterium]
MDCDFLIVGGGVAGLSAAAELADLGSVLLVEAEGAFAHHASGRSAALYEPNYGKPPVVALSLASGPAFHALPGVLSPRGMLMVARADQARAFDRDAAEMDLTPITVEEARARLPILNPATVAHAATADHAWDIDTDLFLQTCQRRARSGPAAG